MLLFCFPLAMGKALKARVSLSYEQVSDGCASIQEPSRTEVHSSGLLTQHASTQTPMYTQTSRVCLNRHACTTHVRTSDHSYVRTPGILCKHALHIQNMHTNVTCLHALHNIPLYIAHALHVHLVFEGFCLVGFVCLFILKQGFSV